ncbi:MAG: hypothetical protein J1F61_06450 [Clostridiales bacterium]|nr:hypothetical protein [Clostridiales bacterium]
MKKSKILAALALSACMALGTTGLIACAPNNGNNGGDSGYTQDTVDPIMEVYNAYVTSAQANGEEPMSYDDWYADLLANAKGDKGDKGDAGDKGDKGDKGEDGAAGKDGNTWLVGATAPTAEQGNDGDLYLDSTTWNVYHKVSGAWVLLGNIKGEKGDKGESGSQGETVAATISVAAGETADMPISGISAGVHIIEADLETKLETGRLQAYIGAEGTKSELVYSQTRSTEGHNVYYGYIRVAAEDTAITFSAITENVEATVEIKDWEMPSLKADGNPVEMPINLYGTTDENMIKIKLDSSVQAGDYTLVITTDYPNLSGMTYLFVGSTRTMVTTSAFANKTINIKESDLATEGDTYMYLICSGSTDSYKQINPVAVTLTAKQA